MKIIKVFNNNVSLVLNNYGVEEIIMGKGVGFNKREGDIVDLHLIEKKFILKDEKTIKEFESILSNVRIEDIELASEIIRQGEKELDDVIDDSIILTLSDHIGFMLKRVSSGLKLKSPLEWDIKRIYYKEYLFSLKALEIIRKRTGFNIPEDEAAFITLHFVNAYNQKGDMNETLQTTKIIQGIIEIVKYHYGREYEESTYTYIRFIAHMRYLVCRERDNEVKKVIDDADLITLIKTKYENDFKCAEKIKYFLMNRYKWNISDSELLYITLHLVRLAEI